MLDVALPGKICDDKMSFSAARCDSLNALSAPKHRAFTLIELSDLPASFHNGACGFSFADGHSEIKKWRNASTLEPVTRSAGKFPKSIPAGQTDDINWVALRATYR